MSYRRLTMGYFLRQDKKKKGTYLQMYESYWNSTIKQPRTRYIESFGYVEELKSEEIPDPVSHYKDIVRKREEERRAMFNEETRPRAFRENLEKNIGHFMLAAALRTLEVEQTINLLASVRQFQFSVYDMLAQLIYSRIIEPCSKSKTVTHVFPMLYDYAPISEDQVYAGLFFVGESYEKYIELFNHQYEQLFKRNYGTCYFDCTNYYFEIDMPKEDKQKGPSKEHRSDPIIGQALLLDADLIPLSMRMYPGNESEKPYIRKVIEEMKQRSKVTGRTIQVADKGLNCAKNIYAAVKEANDGYIFSKSIHGRNLSEVEKQWILLEDNAANKYTEHYTASGELKYRVKSCVDTFEYRFKEADPDTGENVDTVFSVREIRVVSYNPALAEKQKAEIRKAADKAAAFRSYKSVTTEELGHSAKYIIIESTDKSGKKIKPVVSINQAKIDEDMRFAGYNLIVSSEINMSPEKIYSTYHNLWKIEESFRITKSYLDARPVFLQTRETIYGHFLVCYLALFLLRILEISYFGNNVNAYDLIAFIRDFRVVKQSDNTYINISRNRRVNDLFKKATGLANLDALFLSKSEVDDFFRLSLPF